MSITKALRSSDSECLVMVEVRRHKKSHRKAKVSPEDALGVKLHKSSSRSHFACHTFNGHNGLPAVAETANLPVTQHTINGQSGVR